MIRFVFVILLLVSSLNIYAIRPILSIKAHGAVTDILKDKNMLYAATANGTIDVFDIKTKKRLYTINLPQIKDFMGDIINPKVYDLDKLPGNETLVAVVQGNRGFSNVYLISNKKPLLIIKDSESRMMIKRVKFLGPDAILLGLLSNELVRVNLINKQVTYRKQISAYTFSDIVLDKERKEVVTADESGIIHILNAQTGEPIKELTGNNLDNVYQIDYKGSTIICGGQDRRCSIYHRNSSNNYYLKSSFLIYSVGLSPTGKLGAYSANEDNDIKIFNTYTKQTVALLTGSETVITKILFITENELITSSDDPNILFWNLN